MVTAALDGSLADFPTEADPVFGLGIPTAVRDVPSEVLNPRRCWSDTAAYDAQARKLAGMFRKNFERFGEVDSGIKNAGPKG
jgi:phosphoenolpyruvate carboxykinase (ATP)